jgi:hypothetical protein
MSELLKLYRDAQKPYEKFIQYCATAPVGPAIYYDMLLDRYSEADQIFVKRVLELEAESTTLTARIAELEAQVEELKLENERLQDAWLIDETIAPDGSLRPPVSKLIERLEKLEAEVAELKPYRDGYDGYDDYPEEGETVIARLRNWVFLAQHRGDYWYDALGYKEKIRGEVERWWKLPEVQE